MFIIGVNHSEYTPDIDAVSIGEPLFHCYAPLAKVINEKLGIALGQWTIVFPDVGPNVVPMRCPSGSPLNNATYAQIKDVIKQESDGELNGILRFRDDQIMSLVTRGPASLMPNLVLQRAIDFSIL
ncbi:glyceraldehyde-3-phosphate dehydrogenase, cytosolic-like [Rosa chinensis]|uniref:glyceraldehyde-3-phosphate dehydrogenase, cytosolic-like n=1 Tax=Rosa chinensis TaxID=74649 RepID=UPI001AD8A4FC|nr:glyceraldehyde-3-phosphate dehydrogenase, cytosolic-like [Rosa chinensis]